MLSKENDWLDALGRRFTRKDLRAHEGTAVSVFQVLEPLQVPCLCSEPRPAVIRQEAPSPASATPASLMLETAVPIMLQWGEG